MTINHASSLGLFFSTFWIIFLAEFPDKTALATVIMASRARPLAVFTGVAFAFLVQTIVAVFAGKLFGLFPEKWVQIAAGLLFLIFAWKTWREAPELKEGEELLDQATRTTFWGSAYSAFVVIFIAEWGDLTQLSTAALVAKYHRPFVIGIAALAGLWSASGISVLVGHHSRKFLRPYVLQKVGAIVFLLAGLYLMIGALV